MSENNNSETKKTETNKIQIVIDNRKLTLIGPDSQEYMMRVAEFIDKKIKEVRENEATKYLNQTLTLTLAAINIADTYLKEVAERVKASETLKQKEVQLEEYKAALIAMKKNEQNIDITNVAEENQQKSKQIDLLKEENEKLKNNCDEQLKKIEELNKQLAQAVADKERAEKTTLDIETMTTMQDENISLKAQIDEFKDLKQKYDIVVQNFNSTFQEKKKFEEELMSACEEKMELKSKINVLETQLSLQEQKVSSLNQTISDLKNKEDLSKTINDNEDNQQTISSLLNEIDGLKASNKKLTEKLKNLQRQAENEKVLNNAYQSNGYTSNKHTAKNKNRRR